MSTDIGQSEGNLKKKRDNLKILSELFFTNTDLKVEKTRNSSPESIVKSLVQKIEEFHFDPESDHKLESWFHQYEDVLRMQLDDILEDIKVRLLLRGFKITEQKGFTSLVRPRSVSELEVEEPVSNLSKLFVQRSSNSRKCFNFPSLTKYSSETWRDYVSRIDAAFEQSDFSAILENQFKCLLFLCSLREIYQAAVRCEMLSMLEGKDKISLEDLTNKCFKIDHSKLNSSMIPQNSGQDSCAQPREEVFSENASQSCFFFYKPLTDYQFCRTRTETQKINGNPMFKIINPPKSLNAVRSRDEESDIDRRIYLTVRINGRRVKLQLDTASDITMISRKTWTTLGRPELIRPNIVAQNASGGILKLKGELKCRVHYGDRRIRTRCFVGDQSDLNLIGLDWLDELKLLKRIAMVVRTARLKTNTKTNQNYVRKKKRFPEKKQKPIPPKDIEVKPGSKTDTAKKTGKGCLPSKPKVKAVFYSRNPNPRVKKIEEAKTRGKGKTATPKKVKHGIINHCTAINPMFNIKSLAELLLIRKGRSKWYRWKEFLCEKWRNSLQRNTKSILSPNEKFCEEATS
ncbi:unnamed protein product [Hymenolepis diminuta]|uniref:Peptidase A2 domain-containing protein n=1 Tax=Hymenolepis diminuta TaxID=6216 RepID=A0A564YD48_HYMDI|nr:unnamed protein product [Hymenolepis diminuta]